MISFFSWYLLVTLLGWLTFPLAYRLFPALTDRGYTLSRAAGLLVWGFAFWWMATLGFVQNDVSGLVLALLVLVGLSIWAFLSTDGGRKTVDRDSPSTVHSIPFGDRPPFTFTLFCNRSWEPRYGVDVLARAFVKVTASRPEVGLMLLSGGSQGGVLRQILMNGGVLERVHFGGQVSQKDLPNWYHQADLYISPSHVDGSSVSLMEALACGLPCLVSDIPANKEWVTEGENGWLFRDGDADDLAAKILQAIEKRDALAAIGQNARLVAEARADWKKNAASLMQTYETLVKGKRRLP